jgi:hypothetical protein
MWKFQLHSSSTLSLQRESKLSSPFEFGWKVVAIGYGCGFVIGVVIGHIVITTKYGWFVKIFERM